MTEDNARRLADEWVAAWNAHDLDAILSHYDDTIELTSPIAARLLGNDGKVVSKSNLKGYFQRALEAYPNLHFELNDVLWGLHSVVLYYTNQNGIRVAEFMEISRRGRVIRVVANYGGTSGAEAQVKRS
jgi:hypothetical protein